MRPVPPSITTICRSQKMPGNDIQGGFACHIVVPGARPVPVDERARAQGLTLAEVSIVADALTTPYRAVRRAGVDARDWPWWSAPAAWAATACRWRGSRRRPGVAIDVDARKLGAAAADGGASLALNARELDAKALKKAVGRFRAQRRAAQHRMEDLRVLGTAALARPAPSTCWCTAPRLSVVASPWTRSSCACPT